MEQLKKELLKFNKERDWDKYHTPSNLAKSVCVESGELLECFLWSDDYNIDEVKDEIGDVLNNLIVLSDKLNIDLIKCGKEKLKKNEIKYDKDKCKGKCEKYNKL